MKLFFETVETSWDFFIFELCGLSEGIFACCGWFEKCGGQLHEFGSHAIHGQCSCLWDWGEAPNFLHLSLDQRENKEAEDVVAQDAGEAMQVFLDQGQLPIGRLYDCMGEGDFPAIFGVQGPQIERMSLADYGSCIRTSNGQGESFPEGQSDLSCDDASQHDLQVPDDRRCDWKGFQGPHVRCLGGLDARRVPGSWNDLCGELQASYLSRLLEVGCAILGEARHCGSAEGSKATWNVSGSWTCHPGLCGQALSRS